jgi:hypothetical protein
VVITTNHKEYKREYPKNSKYLKHIQELTHKNLSTMVWKNTMIHSQSSGFKAVEVEFFIANNSSGQRRCGRGMDLAGRRR